jgi:hypothetical protein
MNTQHQTNEKHGRAGAAAMKGNDEIVARTRTNRRLAAEQRPRLSARRCSRTREIKGKAEESTKEILRVERDEARTTLKTKKRNKQGGEEQKGEMHRILAKASWERTKHENKFLEKHFCCADRKRLVDRLKMWRKNHGDLDEQKMPPAVSRARSLVIATTPQLQMESINHSEEQTLFAAPPWYGEEALSPEALPPLPCMSAPSIVVSNQPATTPSSYEHYSRLILPPRPLLHAAAVPHHSFLPPRPAPPGVLRREDLNDEAEELATTACYDDTALPQSHDFFHDTNNPLPSVAPQSMSFLSTSFPTAKIFCDDQRDDTTIVQHHHQHQSDSAAQQRRAEAAVNLATIRQLQKQQSAMLASAQSRKMVQDAAARAEDESVLVHHRI